jgi:hypothetical protein
MLVVAQVGFAVALLLGTALAVWENLPAEFTQRNCRGGAADEFPTARLTIDGDVCHLHSRQRTAALIETKGGPSTPP